MAEQTCRCRRTLEPPETAHWWPHRDPEPGLEVRVVAFPGQDPGVLREVRVPGGWHTRGAAACYADRTPPQPWDQTGVCWDGTAHPVVDVTDHVC